MIATTPKNLRPKFLQKSSHKIPAAPAILASCAEHFAIAAPLEGIRGLLSQQIECCPSLLGF